MGNNVNLFPDTEKIKNQYDQINCDRCQEMSEAYYTLSHLTKALYIHCKTCGNHAASYRPGLNILWKPSKAFIKEVGQEEAFKQAKEAEQSRGESQSVVDNKIGSEHKVLQKMPETKLYCDAGTSKNGQKGRQQTIVVVANDKGGIVFEKQIGDYSNNEGEILGIIACLRDFTNNGPILIFSDSQVAVNWANRGWTVYHEKVYKRGKLTDRHKKYIQMANELLTKTKSVVSWIPREQNLAGHYIEEKYKL